jgi:hypothetical protein
MKCFTFSGDKKNEPKSPNSVSVQCTNSTFIEGDVRKSWPDSNSQNVSDTSTESLRRTSFPSLSQKPSNLRVFTVSELKSATKNFSRSAMIGEGGFGCVYKALIKSAEDSSGKIEVAVKQLGKRGLQARLIPHILLALIMTRIYLFIISTILVKPYVYCVLSWSYKNKLIFSVSVSVAAF